MDYKRYLVELPNDETSLIAVPSGVLVSLPGEIARHELDVTDSKWADLHDKLVTHTVKFDTVTKKIVASKRRKQDKAR